jgi:Flp pilus assembly protein TadD
MEPAVRQQIQEEIAAVTAIVAQPSAGEAALAEAFGRCGRAYAAYELSEAAGECFGKAARYAPKDPRWPYYLGALAQKRNDLDAARASFERALALKPGDPPALLRLGELDLAAGRLDAARARFEALLAADPAWAAAALDGLGRVAMQRGDAAAAIQRFEEALVRQPQASVLHYQLGMAYRKVGDLEKARLHLSQYVQGQGAVRTPDPLIDELARLSSGGTRQHVVAGTRALQEKRYAVAVEEYRKALAADPDDASVWSNLGIALQKQGDAAGAEESYRRALSIEAGDARAHYNLGSLLAARGERTQGIEHLEAAVRIDPDLAAARFNLATALLESGEAARALAQYDEILKRTPGDVTAHYFRGTALLRLGRAAEAAEELGRVAAAEPGALEPAAGHASALAALGRFAEAAEEQRRAVALAEQAGRPELPALRSCLDLYRQGRPCPAS